MVWRRLALVAAASSEPLANPDRGQGAAPLGDPNSAIVHRLLVVLRRRIETLSGAAGVPGRYLFWSPPGEG